MIATTAALLAVLVLWVVFGQVSISTSGTKYFEDKEHGFSFRYADKYTAESSRIWGDKEQGGLDITIYSQSGLDDKETSNETTTNSDNTVIAQITVINRDIDEAVKLTDSNKGANKKTTKVCGVTAKTMEISAKEINMYAREDGKKYVTDFQKGNLQFSLETDNPTTERKREHDNILNSFKCS